MANKNPTDVLDKPTLEAVAILKTPHPMNEDGVSIVTIEYPKLYEILMGLMEKYYAE